MRLFRPVGGLRETDEVGDAALLRAVAAGDPAALSAVYDRHAGWLHARLTRRCADPELVREVLQDTFVTVWRSAAGHRGQEAGGWLWTVAARRLVDARRAQERAARTAGAPLEPDTGHAPDPSAEDRVLTGLEYGDVGTALDRLAPDLRDVLRATVLDGLTTREAAVLLGVPEGTVKSRARRARTELRSALEGVRERGDDPGGRPGAPGTESTGDAEPGGSTEPGGGAGRTSPDDPRTAPPGGVRDTPADTRSAPPASAHPRPPYHRRSGPLPDRLVPSPLGGTA